MKKTKRACATGVALRRVFTVMVAFLLVIGFNACSNGGGGGGPGGPGGMGALSGDITISKDGSELTATYTGNEDVEYEWYKDGELIEGATGSTYTATEEGNYTVKVSVPGKSKTSRPVIFNPAYVNPATGKDFEVGQINPTDKSMIFYHSKEGFVMTDTGEICHYLEFSGEQLTTSGTGYVWSVEAVKDLPTETAIGTGRKNTKLMVDSYPWENSSLIKSVLTKSQILLDRYYGGSIDGWFIPSKDELDELCKWVSDINNTKVVEDSGAYYYYTLPELMYWSSSQSDVNNAWIMSAATTYPARPYGTFFSEPKANRNWQTNSLIFKTVLVRAF